MGQRLTPDKYSSMLATFDQAQKTITFYDEKTFTRIIDYLENRERELDLFVCPR